MKRITIMIGTPTYAVKAKNLLSRSGIKSRLVKLDGGEEGTGCTHGLEIYEEQLYSVASVLRERNISYRIHR